MRICAIGVVDCADCPLYVRTFGEKLDKLRASFILHMALDSIDEALRTPAGGAASTPYLGLLTTIDSLLVYGYQSHSNVKFVAVFDEELVDGVEAQALLQQLHSLYADAVFNPFRPCGAAELPPSFDRQVERTVSAAARVLANTAPPVTRRSSLSSLVQQPGRVAKGAVSLAAAGARGAGSASRTRLGSLGSATGGQ